MKKHWKNLIIAIILGLVFSFGGYLMSHFPFMSTPITKTELFAILIKTFSIGFILGLLVTEAIRSFRLK
ncbi:MAG: hypothetical protein G01um101444_241 [Parcubacteria group bacterium Gr01-1014_44]|nr:MAG: hypothetical protein G01um101444_241 [Parcubacteria group bacterium Gr01-1014_44]